MKKIISVFMLSVFMLLNIGQVSYAQDLSSKTSPSNEEIIEYLEDYYKHQNSQNTIDFNNSSESVTNEQAEDMLDFLDEVGKKGIMKSSTSRNTSIFDKMSSFFSVPSPNVQHIPDSFFKSSIELTNHTITSSSLTNGISDPSNGFGYFYIVDRLRYSGSSNTIITNIIFCNVISNGNWQSTNYEQSIKLEVKHVKSIVYDRYSDTFKVLKGFKYIDSPKLAISAIGSDDTVIYKRYYTTTGTKKGSFSGENILYAGAALWSKTSPYLYAGQELLKGIFDEDTPVMNKWESYPKSIENQREAYNGNVVKSVGAEFKKYKLDNEGDYAELQVVFNSPTRNANISLKVSHD